jgi:hypothetical protein
MVGFKKTIKQFSINGEFEYGTKKMSQRGFRHGWVFEWMQAIYWHRFNSLKWQVEWSVVTGGVWLLFSLKMETTKLGSRINSRRQ